MSKEKKSTLGIVVVILLFHCISFAGIGIKAGFNISGLNFGSNDYQSFLGHEIFWLFTNNLTGFQAGFYHTISLSDRLWLQPELLYITRGLSADTDFMYESIDYKVRLNYIQLPLLLKWVITGKGIIRPGLLLGPYGAVKVSANKTVAVGQSSEAAVLENVNSFDYGVLVGVFLEIKLGKGNLNLEFRYNHGFANVLTVPDDFTPLYGKLTNDTIRNFSADLMVGFSF